VVKRVVVKSFSHTTLVTYLWVLGLWRAAVVFALYKCHQTVGRPAPGKGCATHPWSASGPAWRASRARTTGPAATDWICRVWSSGYGSTSSTCTWHPETRWPLAFSDRTVRRRIQTLSLWVEDRHAKLILLFERTSVGRLSTVLSIAIKLGTRVIVFRRLVTRRR